jgi:hypothetical protein
VYTVNSVFAAKAFRLKAVRTAAARAIGLNMIFSCM